MAFKPMLVAGLAAALLVAGPVMAQTAADTPVTSPGPLALDAFFETQSLGLTQLSPSGRYIAFVQRQGSQHILTVHDLQEKKTLAAYNLGFTTYSFDWLRWKTDERLLAGASYFHLDTRGGKPGGSIIGFSFGNLMVALDRDGKNPVALLKSDRKTARKTQNSIALLDILKNDPDHVLAVSRTARGDLWAWKADIHTGLATPIEEGDSSTVGWDTDAAANIVARYRKRGRNLILEGRAPGATAWTEIVRLRPKDLKELPDFEILGASGKPGQVYVAVKPKTPEDGDTRSVRTYDFATRALSEPVWPALKYDITGLIYRGSSADMAGVCYVADTLVCDYRDKTTQANNQALARFFKNERSFVPTSQSDDGRWWLLAVSGPDEPLVYYLYDQKNRRADAWGDAYPSLPSAKLGTMERFTYKTRDGAEVPGYLTSPPGAGKTGLPMVVMPHGGPEMRDAFAYDALTQFLATRGYLVFQPNFRGSGGYGRRYGEAGYGEWGGVMQDDLTDGVKAVIAAGRADPARVCVVGGSYGGYAALYAGAVTPELYKCVVSISGVSDLASMMKWERKESGGEDSERYRYWQRSIGDPATEAEKLARRSPITYAGAYKAPVLLLHGADDDVVPIEQSKRMEKALKAARVSARLVVYDGEGHSFDDEASKGVFKELAAFLSTHIGGQPAG